MGKSRDCGEVRGACVERIVVAAVSMADRAAIFGSEILCAAIN